MQVTIKDPEQIFTIIDNLAKLEIDGLKQMLNETYEGWKEIAAHRILDKLEGLEEKDKFALRVVTIKEILPAHAPAIVLARGKRVGELL